MSKIEIKFVKSDKTAKKLNNFIKSALENPSVRNDGEKSREIVSKFAELTHEEIRSISHEEKPGELVLTVGAPPSPLVPENETKTKYYLNVDEKFIGLLKKIFPENKNPKSPTSRSRRRSPRWSD